MQTPALICNPSLCYKDKDNQRTFYYVPQTPPNTPQSSSNNVSCVTNTATFTSPLTPCINPTSAFPAGICPLDNKPCWTRSMLG
ncbi:Hypothetical protein ZAZAV_442 [Cedratvirus Zaza IHUMI]|uniref:Uncharacterized protein n=1 Tax=Cedratvirus Zaza IHUMI TaxID=2126979 RepID=A0A2R8FFH1_9VIRU|nr:hypothetical protein Cplu_421 [Cedratvirus plubellavi]SPN79696.1 Hypothetical protein ZAZAV_442 [Cedratvirus Zaza IHUMI]